MKIRLWKILLFMTVLQFFSLFSYANDWEFGSQGEHLVPLKNSNMKIKDEKIVMKLEKEKKEDFQMKVKVRFVFENGEEGRKTIGFVTPENERNLGITNFLTKVNGQVVNSQIKPLRDILTRGILDQEVLLEYKEKKYQNSFVYYFEAPFQKGENIVEHEYLYTGSYGIFERDFDYILTTISKWQNQKVENFELVLDMGNVYFKLPYTFWKGHKKIDWEILGDGKSTIVEEWEEEKRVYIRMKNGIVRYRTKNFSPDKEFFAVVMTHMIATVGHLSNPKNSKYILHDNLTELLLRIQMEEEEFYRDDLEKLTDKELEILRNYPYAFAGYDFSRRDLKDYFSQFVWYLPIGKDVKRKQGAEITEIVDKVIKSRK